MAKGGNLFFTDDAGIRKLSPNGVVSAIAVNSTGTYNGEGGLAGLADLPIARGLTADGAGNVYIASGNAIHVLRPVSPLDLKNGYWDVTEHLPPPAAMGAAFEQQLAAAAQYPASQRQAYIEAIRQSQQQAAKGTDSKRGVCVLSDHPLQSLLFDSQRAGQCTIQTAVSGQKLTMNSACTSGNKQAETYVVERTDPSHFKGSVKLTQTDANTGKVTMESNKTFVGEWNRASCAPSPD